MVLASSLPRFTSRIPGFYLSRFLSIMLVCETLATRHAGSKGNKCDGIDSIFEVDKAAKMAGDISDDGSTGADHKDRDYKSWIPIGQSCKTRGMH